MAKGKSKALPRIPCIHGFRISVLTDIEGGIEYPVFSSVRKTPKLLQFIKSINKLGAKESMMGVKHRDVITESLKATTEAARAKAQKAIEQLADDSDKLLIDMGDLFNKFSIAGFMGAGYPKKEAERLAGFLSVEDYNRIKMTSLSGGAKLDLTKASD